MKKRAQEAEGELILILKGIGKINQSEKLY